MQSKSLFDIPVRATKQNDLALAKKSNATVKKATATVKSGGSILTLISNARALTEKSLGKFRDDYLVIRDINAFSEYIDNAIEFGEIAIDTETTGLDPMLNEVVGLCLYSPNQKPCYVPLNHKSYITHERVDNQIPIEQCREVLERLNVAKTKIIMFNAPFDLRVIKNQIGVDLVCYWDCYLAARLMNENEPENKLKPLHQKYVLKGESDEFTFADLFKGITFDLVPIDTAYLYGAHDGIVTYEFYDFQRKYLRLDNEREDLRDIAWVFFNVEMPCVKAVADMEDTGVDFDFEYNDKLKEKYHALLEEKTQHVYELCEEYDEDIKAYRNKAGGIKLDNPINISSIKQLGVLLYDIIGLPQPIDKKTKKATRGTGEDILKGLKHPICDAILEYRTLEKLVSTYIDKLPECVNPNDHRIHGKFNQYGADTGRFSSSDPNLQNIPSHNKDIRKMFKATDEESIVSTDTDIFRVYRWSEIHTVDGWKCCSQISIGDDLDGNIVKSIVLDGDEYIITVGESEVV